MPPSRSLQSIPAYAFQNYESSKMGLRFRRSIKLAPGLRLNWSLGGPSLSVGPRGASVTFGQRGTYTNLGIPGTGLSTREKVGSSQRPSRSAGGPQRIEFEARIRIQDDGSVNLSDINGNPFAPQVERKLRKQNGDLIRSQLATWCKDRNEQIDQLERIHLGTPTPSQKPGYIPEKFEVQPPVKPLPLDVGLWGLLFPWVRKRIEREHSRLIEDYEARLKKWSEDKVDFERRESERKLLLEEKLYTDRQAMHSVLEERLQRIRWPRETNVSFELSPDAKRAYLDVDLPEIEDVPTHTVSLPATGLRVGFKALSDTNRRLMYMRHVHAAGFRLIGETFATLPTVELVILSGYSQRPDTTTGAVKDDYLYSVKAPRQDWAKIHFDKLANIELTECLASFELRRDMTKTGSFHSINPFEVV